MKLILCIAVLTLPSCAFTWTADGTRSIDVDGAAVAKIIIEYAK